MHHEVGPGGAFGALFFGNGRRRSAMVPFERAMVVSYTLFIVTIALSLTIRLQFAMECFQRSNKQGVDHFGANFGADGLTDVSQILT